MQAKDFIIENLNEISSVFNQTTFSYVFDEAYNQHVIVVSPSSEYTSSEFAKQQIQFEIEFIKKFPESDIVFVTDGHEFDLPKFDYVIEGRKIGALGNPFSFKLELGDLTGIFDYNNDLFQYDNHNYHRAIICKYLDVLEMNIPIVNYESIKLYGCGEPIPVPSAIENLNIPVSSQGIRTNESKFEIGTHKETINSFYNFIPNWDINVFPVENNYTQKDSEENSYAMSA